MVDPNLNTSDADTQLPSPTALFGEDGTDQAEDDADDASENGAFFLEDDEFHEIEGNNTVPDIGMSLDDAMANDAAQAPRIGSWKDVPVSQANVRATIGEPTEVVWSEAISEMTFIRQNVFQKEFGTIRPSVDQLSDLLFGPKSKLFCVFKDNLQWSIEDFQHFLKTFLVLSTYKLSVTNMYCAHSYVDTSSLLSRESYIACWRDISLCSLQKNHLARSHIAGQTFWAEIENALNTDLRTKILPSFLADGKNEHFRTIFDDDKMHFNLGRGRSAASLKMPRHICDNQIGPV